MQPLPATLQFSSLRRLQEGPDPRNRLWSRLSSISKIEYKTRIANRFPAETGGWYSTIAQKILDFSKQMHF